MIFELPDRHSVGGFIFALWGDNMRRLIILFGALFSVATHELHIMMPDDTGVPTEYIAHDDSGE